MHRTALPHPMSDEDISRECAESTAAQEHDASSDTERAAGSPDVPADVDPADWDEMVVRRGNRWP
jgi:hypothetical protein